MNRMSLSTIVELFNAPVVEEQAWAICYQCARYIRDNIVPTTPGPAQKSPRATSADTLKQCDVDESSALSRSQSCNSRSDHAVESDNRNKSVTGWCGYGFRLADSDRRLSLSSKSIMISCDGTVSITADSDDALDEWQTKSEEELVRSIGVVVFQLLDYGLKKNEERSLSPLLERVIECITSSIRQVETPIDDVASFDCLTTLSWIIDMCSGRLESPVNASSYYGMVCRDLFTEANELAQFIARISTGFQLLKATSERAVSIESRDKTEWARRWMRVVRELKPGAKLHSLKPRQRASTEQCDHTASSYEALLKDVRDGRYKLNKVQ